MPDLIRPATQKSVYPAHALIDLTIFLAVMFSVRAVEIDLLGFWGNTLFKSLTTVGVATALLRFRRQSWKNFGLVNPDTLYRLAWVTGITLVATIGTIMLFEVFIRDLLFVQAESATGQNMRFEALKGNIPYFLSIVVFVWIESFLEELQDRGFSLNRFESLFSKIDLSTLLAVLIQAVIFGFRHSYDFSPRSITTGLIGLVFGAVYVLSGRNLWPLITAHIFLNTISMIDRI